MKTEEKYMRRCIELAQNGKYGAPPNPMVGAVIVADGRIIGEGWHQHCGEGHAEVNAIASVRQADLPLLRHATIYVSLEPCAHYGKTPPCADLIIKKGIPRVVIGCMDPFAKVAGRGIKKLSDAGCEVIVGVLEKECQQLNRKFFTMHLRKRPYVTLKWAESADGFIDTIRKGGNPLILSSAHTQMLVHRLRAEHMAIMVGRRTALLDNPTLNVRHWAGPSPIRVVTDRQLSLPESLHLFDGSQPTLVFTACQKENKPNLDFIQINFERDIIPQMLEVLYLRGIQSLLVEGGRELLQSFIDSGQWDAAHIEKCPQQIVDGVLKPVIRLKKTYKEVTFFSRKHHIIYNFV